MLLGIHTDHLISRYQFKKIVVQYVDLIDFSWKCDPIWVDGVLLIYSFCSVEFELIGLVEFLMIL